jgi:hypothetical protein
VGREKWDLFLKKYFQENAFQVMDTERFLEHLKVSFKSERLDEKINIDAWVYGPGLPANIPVVKSDRMDRVASIADEWTKTQSLKNVTWEAWSYQEKVFFLTNIKVTNANQLAALDNAYKISLTGNNEVLFAWLMLAIPSYYETAYDELDKFLVTVGRRKFVAPLYESLIQSGQKDLAKKIYEKARPGYHAVTIETVDKMMR